MSDKLTKRPSTEGLDPRYQYFRFDLNAMINFEEMAKKDIAELDIKSKKDLRIAIWAAVKDNLPADQQDAFTLIEAGKMYELAGNERASRFIVESLRASTDPATPGAGKSKKP